MRKQLQITKIQSDHKNWLGKNYSLGNLQGSPWPKKKTKRSECQGKVNNYEI